MPSTIIYKPGDILLIPFPFTDLSTSKKRPCLVVSSHIFNSENPDIIGVAITSQISEKLSEEEYILSEKEQIACGLPKPSMIKLGKIVTLDKRLVRKQLGTLPTGSTKKVLRKIKSIIKL